MKKKASKKRASKKPAGKMPASKPIDTPAKVERAWHLIEKEIRSIQG